jgi:hypothetical protein
MLMADNSNSGGYAADPVPATCRSAGAAAREYLVPMYQHIAVEAESGETAHLIQSPHRHVV